MTARFLLRYDTFSIAIPMCFDDVAVVFRLIRASRGEEGQCNTALTPKVVTEYLLWAWAA